MQQLLDIMQALRNKETGCPWDVAQDFQSLAPYVIEEAYEVVDAIERQDYRELKSELGDLLLQVVFHAQLANEHGLFDFEDVIASINQKMISRHPHVFGDAVIKTQAEQTISWEQIKKLERAEKDIADSSALAGLSQGMPETIRALKLQKKAATVGFDWPNVNGVFEKLDEEIAEIRVEFDSGAGHEALQDEIGDLLFVSVNLARHAKVDFGGALRHANRKFERRFRAMEKIAEQNQTSISQLSLSEQETLWQHVKLQEKINESI
ncbi:MAG TPA: nucleoside triphosphate pyrophosphohydrolase [Arenimonas sp.]|nr:nucleoside triphosphate pyrophosphohydrolase [Arenimonas sp.]